MLLLTSARLAQARTNAAGNHDLLLTAIVSGTCVIMLLTAVWFIPAQRPKAAAMVPPLEIPSPCTVMCAVEPEIQKKSPARTDGDAAAANAAAAKAPAGVDEAALLARFGFAGATAPPPLPGLGGLAAAVARGEDPFAAGDQPPHTGCGLETVCICPRLFSAGTLYTKTAATFVDARTGFPVDLPCWHVALNPAPEDKKRWGVRSEFADTPLGWFPPLKYSNRFASKAAKIADALPEKPETAILMFVLVQIRVDAEFKALFLGWRNEKGEISPALDPELTLNDLLWPPTGIPTHNLIECVQRRALNRGPQ